jgi:hypothetical protein
MESLSNKQIRLYRPPTPNEMMTEGIYFSVPNDCSSEIMRHLGHYFLYLLILVNKSFYNVLNRSRSLENGLTILVYGHERIDPELLKRLYEEDEALLNQHKATCHRRGIPPRSMIICSTKWPDIDSRELHLISLVNPKYPNTLAFRTFWCGNISSFDYTLYNNTDLTSYGVLKWRDENGPPNILSRRRIPFCFSFSLEERGHLEVTVLYLERETICINVLPEFWCSTNTLENTLGIPVVESSVTLTIGDCKNLNCL